MKYKYLWCLPSHLYLPKNMEAHLIVSGNYRQLINKKEPVPTVYHHSTYSQYLKPV